MTNYYLTILKYLKQFEGDGKFYEVKELFELPETDANNRNIIKDLVEKDLVKRQVGTGIRTRPPSSAGIIYANGTMETFGGPSADWQSTYIPNRLKITFDGSAYLKKELEMNERNSTKIGNVTNSYIVVNSPNSSINIGNTKNQSEVIDITRKIVETLKVDNSVNEELRAQHLVIFQTLMSQAENGNIEKETGMKALTVGDSVSSIGSFLVSLGQILVPMLMK
jgi:hypothetical protein